jgi:DNA-binding response OmpR family regulator
MSDILLCSHQPARLLWLEYSFRRANYTCRITTEWKVLLRVTKDLYVDAVLFDGATIDAEHRCRQIRAMRATPLIVLGTNGTLAEELKLRAAGADEVLGCEMTFDVLLARVENMLYQSRVVGW